MGAGDHCLQPDPPVSLQRQALKPSPPIGPVRCFSTNSNLHSARLSSHNFPPVPTSARPPLFTQTLTVAALNCICVGCTLLTFSHRLVRERRTDTQLKFSVSVLRSLTVTALIG